MCSGLSCFMHLVVDCLSFVYQTIAPASPRLGAGRSSGAGLRGYSNFTNVKLKEENYILTWLQQMHKTYMFET